MHLFIFYTSPNYIREIRYDKGSVQDQIVFEYVEKRLVNKKLEININDLSKEMIIKFPHYAFIGIVKRGSIIFIKIEMEDTINKIINFENLKGDFVSKYKAYIEQIIIERGSVVAQLNTTVKVGELLVSGNLKLVLSLIKKYINKVDNMDDLFQVGCIGLMKAIDNFDMNHNVRFSTYACPMIIGEVRRYLRDNGSIRVSRSYRDIAYKAINYKDNFISEHQREPSINEIAEYLNVDINKTVAIGDFDNDVEMLKVARLGIAVSNASEKVLAVADDVTVSNEEHAIAQIIADIESGKMAF